MTRTTPRNLLQARWERGWTAALGAWFAILLALLLGAIDWRAGLMAATAFMLARSGDMLDNYDDQAIRPVPRGEGREPAIARRIWGVRRSSQFRSRRELPQAREPHN